LRFQAGFEVRQQRRRGDQFARARDQILGLDRLLALEASIDRFGQPMAEQTIQNTAVDFRAAIE